MKNLTYPLLILSLFLSIGTSATTWDEPWQETILKKSESFVQVKVESVDEEKGIWAEIIQTIAGESIKGRLHIYGFFLLHLTSSSGGHGAEFKLPPMDTAYYFLKKGDKGNYLMPTPTSGFARVRDGYVECTYRISMHKGMAPVDMYEKSMSELFKFNKTGEYDKVYFEGLFDEYLSQNPGKVDGTGDEMKLFFLQHVALESFYYVGEESYYKDVVKFLESDQFHNQISGIRALSKINTPQAKESIFTFIQDNTKNDLARVLVVDALRRLDALEYNTKLASYLLKALDEIVGYVIIIREVRTGTKVPGILKDAVDELLKQCAEYAAVKLRETCD